MTAASPRSNEDIAALYDRQVDTVYRVCFAFMKNRADTEDMVQSVFLKLLDSGKSFDSFEHEKAWLIVTASNLCKNSLKGWWRRNINIDNCESLSNGGGPESEVLMAITELPNKYKTAIYLFYYEGYHTEEIARMVGRPASTVRNHLSEGRAFLKKKLGGNFNE